MLNCTYKHMHAHCKVVTHSQQMRSFQCMYMHVCIWIWMAVQKSLSDHWRWSPGGCGTKLLSSPREAGLLILEPSFKSWPLYVFPKFSGLITCCGVSKIFFLFGVTDCRLSKDTLLHFHSFFFSPENLCFRYTVQCGSLGFSLRFLGFASPYLPALVSLGEMGEVQIILWLTRL